MNEDRDNENIVSDEYEDLMSNYSDSESIRSDHDTDSEIEINEKELGIENEDEKAAASEVKQKNQKNDIITEEKARPVNASARPVKKDEQHGRSHGLSGSLSAMESSSNPQKNPEKQFYHDFFNDRKWLMFVGAYGNYTNPLYICYRLSLLLLHFFLQSMAIYACYLSAPNKVMMIDALHVYFISSFATWGLLTRFLTEQNLQRTHHILREGIYHYEDEDLDEEEVKMKEGIVDEVRRKSVRFIFVFSVGTFSNMVFFPLSQLVLHTEDPEEDHSDEIVNPYLPHVFYTPFSTRNIYGYALAYILSASLLLYVYGVAMCMNEIFLSCIIQLKIQLRILGHSISNIQKRAYIKYLKNNNLNPGELTLDDLYSSTEFQKCLYSCFRANIKHHQALIKFKKELQIYGGACMLDTVILGTLKYATALYLGFQKLPMNFVINHFTTFLVEQTYPFYECVYGEEIIKESSLLFEMLYGMPWCYFDRSLNKSVGIFMSNSIKPMRIKALFLKASASLETFGDLAAGVYKIMNLVRSSDL